MAHRDKATGGWMADRTLRGRRLRRRARTKAEAQAIERAWEREYEQGLTDPIDACFADYVRGTYVPEHLETLAPSVMASSEGPLVPWLLGPLEEPTSLARLPVRQVGGSRAPARAWLEEVLHAGVWFMARPPRRAWGDRGLLVPCEPCPRCGGPVIERPAEPGERYRSLELASVRECLPASPPRRGHPRWEPGQVGCGARAERRLATIELANDARHLLSRILNYAKDEGGLVMPGGVSPASGLSARRIKGPDGRAPRRGAKREKRALGPLDIELIRAFLPTMGDVYMFELLYYGMHRPGDLAVARFSHLAHRIVNPLAQINAWQLRFQRQKALELREEQNRSTVGLVTLPEIVALGLRRLQALMGASAGALVCQAAGRDPAKFNGILSASATASGVGHVIPYNGRLSVSCLRRRAGEDPNLVAREGDHTVAIMERFYTEAGYDSLSFGPVKPLGDLIAMARPEAEARALAFRRAELAALEAEVRQTGETVLRMKAEGASIAALARALGVGRKRARSYYEAVIDDPMQAGLVARHHRLPPPRETLRDIRSNIEWLERHGIADNPYPPIEANQGSVRSSRPRGGRPGRRRRR